MASFLFVSSEDLLMVSLFSLMVLKVPANTTCKVHALTFKLRLNFTLLIIDRGQLEILQYLYWGTYQGWMQIDENIVRRYRMTWVLDAQRS